MDSVVLLHSSAASARQWDALVERLRPSFDVHAIDLYGHGHQAAWPHARPLSLRDEAALVMPLLARVGRAHLVGHSYGGAIAMAIACEHPSMVHSLAVFEPVLFRLLAEQDAQGAATREAFAVFGSVRSRMSTGQILEAARTFVDYWSGPGAWASLAPEQQRQVSARMHSVSQQFDVVCKESLPATQLDRLTVPTLCLSGSHTTAAGARIASLLQSRLAAAEHQTLPGMGHMGPLTHAPVVNQHLMRFLGRHAVSPAAPHEPCRAAQT